MSQGISEASDATDPRIGTVVAGRYRIISKLGEGGMGVVYEAEHEMIRKRVALKCLHAQYAKRGEVVARFHREAQAATSVGNEHIVEVTDMGRFDDGSLFMVLEFLDGQDLAHAIKKARVMSVKRTVHIVSQVCEALEAAHAKGIVHRDLKPENIFLIHRGGDPDFVKVLDFGISKFNDPDAAGEDMTRTGATLGTPLYMSPEQISHSKGVDARTDIYALGVILFKALTGTLPFRADTLPALVMHIHYTPAPLLRSIRPDLPGELDAVVQRMLAKNREERFPDCAAVRDALRAFASLDSEPGAIAAGPPGFGLPAPTPSGYTPQSTPPGITPQGMSGPMAFAPPGPASQPAVQTPVASAATPASTRIFPAEPTNTRASTPGPSQPASSAGGASGRLAVGALVAVAMSAGGALVYFAASNRAAQNAPPAAAQLAPAPGPTAAPGPGAVPTTPLNAPGPAPVPVAQTGAMVNVKIGTVPRSATLYLDHERIANPFDADLPQTSAPRNLEARLDGYVTVVQDLVLRFPQRITIEMQRGSGTDDRRAVRAAPTAGSRPTNPASPGPTPAAPAAPQPASTGPAPARAPQPATTQPAQPAQPAQTQPARRPPPGVVVPPDDL